MTLSSSQFWTSLPLDNRSFFNIEDLSKVGFKIDWNIPENEYF